MADDDLQDQSQKTEEPTQRRLEEAVKKGQVPFSREVASFMIFVMFTIIMIWMAPFLMERTKQVLFRFIDNADQYSITTQTFRGVMIEAISDIGAVMIFPISLFVIAAFAASMIQNGFIISFEPIKPKLEKISPIKGLKRLFSLRSITEFVKGIIKISLVAAVAVIVVWPEMIRLETLPGYNIEGILELLEALAVRILIGVTSVMLVIAVLDFLYQKHEHIKNLRMSKQEIKEEHKQQEGDPLVKQKLRQIRMERARQRMMSAVPEADVVITNPTHYSVALQYDAAQMSAPRLIAKGIDNIALKIREVAREHDIPIVENAPLARTLYETVETDEEIPVEHYQAVAEIIGYVYRLKGRIPPRQQQQPGAKVRAGGGETAEEEAAL